MVSDLAQSISDVNLEAKLLGLSGIGKKSLRKWQEATRDTIDGEYVSVYKDHRTADNPYVSKYADDWEAHMTVDLRKQKIVCVTELARHMYDESKKFYFRGHRIQR